MGFPQNVMEILRDFFFLPVQSTQKVQKIVNKTQTDVKNRYLRKTFGKFEAIKNNLQ